MTNGGAGCKRTGRSRPAPQPAAALTAQRHNPIGLFPPAPCSGHSAAGARHPARHPAGLRRPGSAVGGSRRRGLVDQRGQRAGRWAPAWRWLVCTLCHPQPGQLGGLAAGGGGAGCGAGAALTRGAQGLLRRAAGHRGQPERGGRPGGACRCGQGPCSLRRGRCGVQLLRGTWRVRWAGPGGGAGVQPVRRQPGVAGKGG